MSSLGSASVPQPAAARPDAVVATREPLAGPPKQKGGITGTIVLSIGAVIWISPLVLLLITSVRPLADFIASGPLTWPNEFTWANFTAAVPPMPSAS